MCTIEMHALVGHPPPLVEPDDFIPPLILSSSTSGKHITDQFFRWRAVKSPL